MERRSKVGECSSDSESSDTAEHTEEEEQEEDEEDDNEAEAEQVEEEETGQEEREDDGEEEVQEEEVQEEHQEIPPARIAVEAVGSVRRHRIDTRRELDSGEHASLQVPEKSAPRHASGRPKAAAAAATQGQQAASAAAVASLPPPRVAVSAAAGAATPLRCEPRSSSIGNESRWRRSVFPAAGGGGHHGGSKFREANTGSASSGLAASSSVSAPDGVAEESALPPIGHINLTPAS